MNANKATHNANIASERKRTTTTATATSATTNRDSGKTLH